MTAKMIISDKDPITPYMDALVIIVQAKPNNIFRSVCPDIILAKSLVDRLRTRET
jgi:hypothetical protein